MSIVGQLSCNTGMEPEHWYRYCRTFRISNPQHFYVLFVTYFKSTVCRDFPPSKLVYHSIPIPNTNPNSIFLFTKKDLAAAAAANSTGTALCQTECCP